jgi:hypothetical protein
MRIKKGGRTEENDNNENSRKNRNSELGISLRNIIAEQKKYSAKELRLKNMMWGMGLEHEVQYFYLPTSAETDKKYPASEIVLFKSLKPAQNLPKKNCCPLLFMRKQGGNVWGK